MELKNNPFPFLENNTKEIEYLFSELKKHFWEPNKSKSIGLWHEFDLPSIEISNEERSPQDSYFDVYLGMYASIDKGEWNKEGRIILFKKSLEETANVYHKESGVPFDECFSDISKIVLLHELGHWILHQMPTANSSQNNFYNFIEIDLHEAIAQFIVTISISGNQQLLKIFNWLCKNQNQIYKNKLSGNFSDLSAFRFEIEICYLQAHRIYWLHKLDQNIPESSILEILKTLTPETAITNNWPKTFDEYQKCISNNGFSKLKKSNFKKKFGI